jgi:ubiquinone/menaquinone biosynthesis C-methylase UbiE
MRKQSSSWGKSSKWYGKLVGTEGHYYHQHVILPTLLKMISLNKQSTVLDVGCGQGIFERAIDEVLEYWGIDVSGSLIAQAKNMAKHPHSRFSIDDACLSLRVPDHHFSHAVVILALQNMKDPHTVIANISRALTDSGELYFVLNHPCFRIPRQSGWEIDEQTKQQRRWITRYLTPMTIPVLMHPGQSHSESTVSFHHSLSDYMEILRANGFVITDIKELTSDKESVGKASKMENRSRNDIPLFMILKAQKSSL